MRNSNNILAAQHMHEPDKNRVHVDMKGENRSILIIDDDEDILKMLSMLLSRKGYVIETAKNGAEAIEKSKARTFNAALIDIVLPDMNGTQLLTKLNGALPKIRKIIITGHAMLDNAVEAVNLGADAYLTKPLDSQELIEVVETQLQNQREENTMTPSKFAEYIETRKTNFVELVVQSLDSFWGESITQATIHQIGGAEAIKDPNVFAEKLKTVFREGAELILKLIIKNLEASSEKS